MQAYATAVKKLSINGSKYNIKNYNLNVGDCLTLSNEFQNNKVTIKFTKGEILLFRNFSK